MIQSDAIRQALREKLENGMTLKTTGGAEFLIESINPTEIVFRAGEKKARIAVMLEAIDDLVKEFRFIPPGGWMRIGAVSGEPKPGTLAAVVRAHTQGGSSASQFASILEHIQVAEVNPARPARIRLTV